MKNKKSIILIALLVPLLVLTRTVEQSIIFSVTFIVTFTLYALLIHILKKITKKEIKECIEIILSTLLLSIIIYFFKLYIPFIYENDKIYYLLLIFILPILYRKLEIESNKKNFIHTILFVTILFVFTGFIKEIIGSGTITLMDLTQNITGYIEIIHLPVSTYYPISYFQTSSFSFLLVAIILCVLRRCEK